MKHDPPMLPVPPPPRGERGVTGSPAAASAAPLPAPLPPPPPQLLPTAHLCTVGEVVEAHRKSSSLPTASRSTGCCSQASSSLTRVPSRVLQAAGAAGPVHAAWQAGRQAGRQGGCECS
jgi:hypothetical protein